MGEVPEFEVPDFDVPELLTIEEAARILRVSRNTAYQQARQYRASNGERGLEVVDAGGQMRVPRRRLEERLQITIDSIPPPRQSKGRGASDPRVPDRQLQPDSDPPADASTRRATVGYPARFVWKWRIRR